MIFMISLTLREEHGLRSHQLQLALYYGGDANLLVVLLPQLTVVLVQGYLHIDVRTVPALQLALLLVSFQLLREGVGHRLLDNIGG